MIITYPPEMLPRPEPGDEVEVWCACGACVPGVIQHASDCAVHNAPAFPAGPCTCNAVAATERQP